MSLTFILINSVHWFFGGYIPIKRFKFGGGLMVLLELMEPDWGEEDETENPEEEFDDEEAFD